MSILVRLCLLVAAVSGLTAATAVDQLLPLSTEVVPHDHRIEVKVLVHAPYDSVDVNDKNNINDNLNSSRSQWTVQVAGQLAVVIPGTNFGMWANRATISTNDDATTVGVSLTPDDIAWGNATFASATNITVTFSLDADGLAGFEHTGSVTFQARAFSQAEQPFRPITLPPLSVGGRAEIGDGQVRRQNAPNADVVLAGGTSLVNPGQSNEVGHAALWRFTGSAVETISVHQELINSSGALGIVNVAGSMTSAVNGVGQAAGLCLDDNNTPGTAAGANADDRTIAWFREANGTLRMLAVVATGALANPPPPVADEDEEDTVELSHLGDDGWVLTDTMPTGGLPVSTPLPGYDPPTCAPFRAMAYRWNGSSVTPVDLHAGLVTALGGSATVSNVVTGAFHAREGSGGNLGALTGVVYSPNAVISFRPFVRAANGTITIAANNAQGLGSDFAASLINAAGNRVILNKWDEISDSESTHLGIWSAGTGVTLKVDVPKFFVGAVRSHHSQRSAVENGVSNLDLVMGDWAYDSVYRPYVQQVATLDGTPTFPARIYPEFLAPAGYLMNGGIPRHFQVERADGNSDGRVYAGNAWGNGSDVLLLLVHKDRITDASDLTIAYPKSGSTIPVGHQPPIVVKIDALSLLRTATKLEMFLTTPGAAEVRIFDTTNVNELVVGAWSIERRPLNVAGVYQVRAVLTYSDATTYEETTSFTAAVVAPTYQLFELPLPPGANAGSAEAKRVLLDVADSNKVWVAGGADYPGNTTKPVYWTWRAGESVQSFAIDVPANIGVVTGFSALGGWAMDVGLVDNIPTILIGKAKSNGNGTEDQYLLSYRPSQVGSEWHVIGRFAQNVVLGDDPLESEPQFFANGDVYSEAIVPTGLLPPNNKYAYSAQRFVRSALTWSPVAVVTPGAPANNSIIDDASGTYGVGVFLRADDTRRAFYQLDGNTTAELTGLPVHPDMANSDMWIQIAKVGGSPRFGINRSKPISQNRDSLRAFIRNGTAAGSDIALQPYSDASDYIDLYALNDDGDVAGEVTLIDEDNSRATRWDPATGVAADVNFMISPARLIALGAGSDERLELEEVFAMTSRVTGGQPIMVGEGGFNDPLANGGLGAWQEREYIYVPLDFLPPNNIPVLTAIGQQSTVINTSLVLNVVATDGDVGDTLTFSATGQAHGSLNVVGNTLTYAPVNNFYGQDQFTVVVDDGKGGTDSETVSVVITSAGGDTATITASTPLARETGTNGEFQITLASPAPVGGRLVKLGVSGTGTAERGVDYVLKNFGALLPPTGDIWLSIPSGNTFSSITVEPINDSSPEGDETVVLDLLSVGSTSISAQSATVTIEHSDYEHFVLWVARKSVNNHPEQGEYGAINWWMEAAPGRTLTGATFTFPGSRTVAGEIRDGGQVADVGKAALGEWDVSLAALQTAVPNGTYSVELVYATGPNEIRTQSATFNWVSGWPAYPTVVAPLHNAANVTLDGQQRVTASWSGPALNFVSVHPLNGPGINSNRDRYESDWSDVNGVSSFLIPVQLMTNQPYLAEFMAMSNDGRMGTITHTGFSTGAMPVFGAGSDNLANTPVGDMTNVANLSLRHRADGGAVTFGTRTISREQAVLPGSAGTMVDAVKVVEITDGGARTQIQWFARSTDNSLYLVRESINGAATPPAVPTLIIPGGATVGATWFSGYGFSETALDYAISRLFSTTATSPIGLRAQCLQINVTAIANASTVFERTWTQSGFGMVEHSTSVAADGIDYIPLVLTDPPVIAATSLQNATEDAGAITVNLTATDLDTDVALLSWSVANGLRGTASVNPTTGGATTLTYTPSANQFGSDSVVVTVSDGTGNSDTETVSITITGVNDAPSFTVGAPTVTVSEDSGAYGSTVWATSVSAGPLESQSLTFTVTNNNNSLFLAGGQPAMTASGANGVLTFTPAANANGSAIVTVKLSDGDTPLDTTPVNFTITVTPINDPPIATLAVIPSVNEDAILQTIAPFVTAISPGGGADETAQTVTASISNDNATLFSGQPALVANGPDFDLTYMLAPNNRGSAVISVLLTDSDGATASVTRTLTVNAVNDAPVNTAVPTITGTQSIGSTLTATAGTWNDLLDQTTPVFTYAYQWQRATDNVGTGATNIGTNAATYVLIGADTWVRVSVTATDNGVGTPATASATSDSIWVRGINAIPVITGNAPLTIVEDIGSPTTLSLSATDIDLGGGSLTWSIQTGGGKGNASVSPLVGGSTTFSYAPVGNAFGNDSVVVACSDGVGGVGTVAVLISITGVNDAPIFALTPASDTILEDAGLRTITGVVATPVTAGPGGETGVVTLSIGTVSTPALFSVQPAIAQNGTLTYTPAPNASGYSSVQIIATDDGGGANSNTQIFDIFITAVNDAPTFTLAAGPTVLEDAGTQTIANFLTGLSDGVDPAEVQVVAVSSVTNNNPGLFVIEPEINPSGTLTFETDPNANGTATVTVVVADDGGTANGGFASSTQTFIITVTAVNDVPSFVIGANQSANADSGAVSISGWATVISAGAANESQTLTFATTNNANGLFLVQPAVSSAGTLSFTPKPGQTGSAIISVTLADNGTPPLSSVAQTATITVTQGPAITTQPVDQLIVGGTAANLSVAASGTPTPTYQWQVFTSSWNDVGGETNPLFAPTVSVQTQYRCVATNVVGSVISNVATITVGTVPVITDEADPTSVPIGGSAMFTVVASGSPAPTYQWHRSTTTGGSIFDVIPNATGASYSFGPVAVADSGFLFRCVVTNTLGVDTSVNAALTVTAIAPAFVQHPQPRSVVAGSTATFSVVVSGNPVPTLQWQRSDDAGSTWSPIGTNTASFTTSATVEATDHNDRYRCIATNTGGSTTSSEVVLSVLAAAVAPTVTPASTSVTVPAGQLATLSVTATGSPTPTLQWRRGSSIIGGATGSSLSFTAGLADSGATFTCTASNSAGVVPSAVITLTVTAVAPTVSISGATTVNLGSSVTLTAAATGVPVPGLQWMKGASAIAGATGPSYVWTPVLGDIGAHNFTCVATNAALSVTSNTLGITVTGLAPGFTTHPVGLSVATNGWATFTVVSTGTPAPSLQWQTSANNGGAWSNVGGGTAASLTVQAPGTLPSPMPQYRCVATNVVGTGTSNAATLTVTATAPVIVTQPADLPLANLAGGSFTVAASSSGALTYQWYRRPHGDSTWLVIPDATTNSLPVTANLTINQGSHYRCVVTAGLVSVATRAALLTITSPPQFTTEPANLIAAIGDVAVFTAEAVGGPQPTYQWYRSANGGTDWTAVTGATGTSLAFTVKVSDVSGTQQVQCKANNGTIVDSFAATLSVSTIQPSFTTQPVGSTIPLDGQALLAVAVAGSPTPTVQWQTSTNGADFNNVANAGTALTYTTPVASAAGSTWYRCLASNAAGTLASDAVLVQVQIIAPYVIQQPVSVTTVPTATATFSVVAAGSATLTYQWQKRDAGASPDSFANVGTNAASFTTAATSVLADDGDQYRCVITNGAGSTYSNAATLSVQLAPVAPAFTAHPAPSSAVAGQPVSFSVVVTGVPTPTLQWSKGTVAIPGATFPTLLIDAADYADNGAAITCIATSSAGTATSNPAALTVTPIAPSITTQPVGVNAGAGSELSLSLVATGTGPLTYQWKRDGSDVTGAIAATYVVARCSTSSVGMWTCVVTGPGTAGSVTSQGAQVTVSPVFFPVLTDLLDLSVTPPEVVAPTPAAYGLGDGELLKWITSNQTYVPVAADEQLTVGGSYFLDQGGSPTLLPRYAPAPAPTTPPELDLDINAWNPAAVVVANTIDLGEGDGPVTLQDIANDPTAPTVWVVDPITGAMQMVGNDADVIGGTTSAPAGSSLWIDTGATNNDSSRSLRAPPMPKGPG